MEYCAGEVCQAEVCPAEVCPGKVCPAEVRLDQVCPAEVCLAKVCNFEVCLTKECSYEVCPTEVCVAEIKRLVALFVFAIPSSENRQDSLNIGTHRLLPRWLLASVLPCNWSMFPNVRTQYFHDRPMISFGIIRDTL